MNREYVTIDNEKRNLGLKGLEISDFVLFLIGLLIFIFLIIALKTIKLAFYFLIIYAFCLLPINLSNKNRVYKILWMLILYILNNHVFIYEKDKKEGMLNEYTKKAKEFKNRLKVRINDGE